MTKILVCDDHRLVAEALALVLEGAGHEVVAVVGDPAEALDALERTKVGVCVMDVRYGEETGFAGIAAVADRHPDVRIVVFSGHLEDDVIDEIRRAGATAWGLKHGDLASVVALVVGESDEPVFGDDRDRWEDDPLARFLTRREREVLHGLACGETTPRLARRLGVSDATVRTHTQSILNKLGVHSRLEAVAYAIGRSLIAVDPRAPSALADRVPSVPLEDRTRSTA